MDDRTAEPELTEEELVAIMRSPKYWKQRDPSTLAKVTAGFKRLYPDPTPTTQE
jgi:hypothetical protein